MQVWRGRRTSALFPPPAAALGSAAAGGSPLNKLALVVPNLVELDNWTSRVIG